MRRTALPIVIAVVAIALVFVGVGALSPANAAVVNGRAISESTVQSDLSAVASDNAYLCYLNASALIRSQGRSGLSAVHGATPGSYSASFVNLWMNQEITFGLLAQQAEARGIGEPSAADLAQARSDLYASVDAAFGQVAGSQYGCQLSAEATFKSLPKDFVDRQVRSQALSEAFLAKEAGLSLSPAGVRSYYDAHRGEFARICLSGMLLASQADAAAAKAAVDGGASFATEAASRSLDAASKARGGQLGCFDPSSSQYSSVIKLVGSIPEGGVTEPLQNQGGQYAIYRVDSRTAGSFDAVATAVRRTLVASAAEKGSAAVGRLLADAEVSVAPRYGTWKTISGRSVLVPPATPAAQATPNAAANQPGGLRPSGAAGSAPTGR